MKTSTLEWYKEKALMYDGNLNSDHLFRLGHSAWMEMQGSTQKKLPIQRLGSGVIPSQLLHSFNHPFTHLSTKTAAAPPSMSHLVQTL
ncbi:hypothetical protein E2C01_072579 [Portunus trituberculatus]|uniref:Uncharacterized protein n=1 Tax=Portunus trituberculatus TaxID=210409 RepID=A0A5B7HYE8_PORTR|nr:hypothetical protein [Portunus trituberculatus]